MPIDSHTNLAADHYPVVADIELPGSEVGVERKTPTLPERDGQESSEDDGQEAADAAAPCCERRR